MKIEEQNESIHTRISYYSILLSVIFQLFLAFKYIGSANLEAHQFGFITFIYGVIAIIGLLLTDPMRGQPVKLKPKRFQNLHINSIFRALIILLVIRVVQISFGLFTLTIRDEERALAIVFAAPSEEVFFRGFLLSFVIIIAQIAPGKKFKLPGPGNREISIIEITGIIISSLLFAYLHTNYFNNLNLLLMVFVSGLFLGFFYWLWRDLTANILAHLFLNIWVVGQYFWMVNF